jgi:hypothetical protein
MDVKGGTLIGRRRVFRSNVKLARTTWEVLSRTAFHSLKELTVRHGFSIAGGDLRQLDGRWYVTHTGLLGIARRNHCSGVRVQLVREFCDSTSGRWVFKVTVYKSLRSRGFVGYGDADPSNVSSLVHGAEMRVAPKPAPSTAPSARPTASDYVRSRNSTGLPGPRHPNLSISPRLPRTEIMATGTGSLASATASAC